jgi:glycosyltransferase involved in cell wall biosynthesis
MREHRQGGRKGDREDVRALYVVPSADFGGQERQLAATLPQLADWGVHAVPLLGPGGRLACWLEEDGLRDIVHTPDLPVAARGGRGLGGWLRTGGACRGALRVQDEVDHLIHERSIDVVVGVGPTAWLAAAEPARRHRVPLVWAATDLPAAGEGTLVRALGTFHRPDLLLCAGASVEEAWAPLVHVPSEVVPGAVDLNRFRAGRGQPARFRPDGAGPVIGLAGRLTEEKRPGDVVALATRLRREWPRARFLVAGDGPERAGCEAQAHAAGVADAFLFLGYVDDMRSFYGACDLVVVPSAQGRPAQSALEALAMDVPVVTSDRVGASGALPPEAAAELTYPVGDVDALAAVVRRVMGKPDRTATLTAWGHERVRRQFDAQRTARRTARLLQALVVWTGATPTPVPVRAERRLTAV